MYLLSKLTFYDLISHLCTKDSILNIITLLQYQRIQLEKCLFLNLTTSSSSHSGAIYLSNLNGIIKDNDFIECSCENKVNNEAGNAIRHYLGNLDVMNCKFNKCSAKLASESAIAVKSSESLIISYSNFTDNVAHDSSNNFGSPSVECISETHKIY